MNENKNRTSDVETGGKWAKWFGIAKMALGILLLWLLSSSDLPTIQFTGLDAIIQIGIGAISLYLGLQILNPDSRKLSHFTVLIVIYGISVTLHFFNYLMESASGAQPSGMIVPVLTVWALWKFIKGRKELKKIESSLAPTD